MNQKEFIQFVEETRDCDLKLLDNAINKGFHRATDQQLDVMKIIHLIGAGAVAAALILTINLEPVRAALEMIPSGNLMTQSGAEALQGYINDFTNTLTHFFGGN